METKKKFGLIGKQISYSFSKKYFTDKFQRMMLPGYSYEIFDISDISYAQKILDTENLVGINVTIPYKQEIIPLLDELNEEAKKIGAVNTILIKNKKKIGYNTDAAGFEKSLMLMKKDYHRSALILGDGGAAKAVKYVLSKHEIPYKTVSRKGELNFENIAKKDVANHKLIIQCTPVGTFPSVNDCLDFPFEGLSDQHLIIDLIYNPNYTEFIKKSAEYGAKTMNGLYMLEQQAEEAWKIWNRTDNE